jgi:Ni/Fe-hydrogenase subunit HybB-like protein
MRVAASSSFQQRIESVSTAPLELKKTSTQYKLLIGVLAVIIGWGLYAYVTQIYFGLIMTGMRDYVSWGFYIFNFVFWVGVSLCGALVSAVLRLANAGWRTPLTRIAELITVSALILAGMMIIFDVGRPDRALYLFFYGRFGSPLIWDLIGLMTYMLGSFVYLYLPAIADFAILRDRLQKVSNSIKYKIYSILAVGWTGTKDQKSRLARAARIMTVMIIPIGCSMHTVTAFTVSMTLRPGWDTAILAPNFVVGAFFSGVGVLIFVMGIFRKFLHLEEWITEKHFKYLSYLAVTMLFTYLYFVVVEYITVIFKLRLEEKELFTNLFLGPASPWFYTFVVTAFLLPAILLLWQRQPAIPRIMAAGLLINVGMWVKRYVIVIPTLEVPLMPTGFQFATYTPSWVEISIAAMGFAIFALILALAAKALPIMPFAEVIEEHEHEEAAHHGHEETTGRA